MGKITDDEGAPLPGVSVTASSPALIGGSSVSYSDLQGNYRFPVLPPGTYEVKAELQGYQTVARKETRLFVGNTVTVDLSLAPQQVAETLEVVGDRFNMDATSAQSSNTVPVEAVEGLPKFSFALDLFTLTAGVGQDYVAFGAAGESANAYWLDGVDLSDPFISTSWVFPNYNWIQEVNVVGIGAPAEYGGFTGVVTNSITRSGSNEFHGLMETYFQNDGLTSVNTGNLSPELQDSLNPPTVDFFTDTTAQIGGPILKDKFWFFGSFRYFYTETLPLGADREMTDTEPSVFGKLTYKMNQNNTLQGFLEWDRFDIEGRFLSASVPFEASSIEEAPNLSWNASWISLLNPQTVLDMRYSGFTGYFDLFPVNGQIPGHLSLNTGQQSVNAAGTNLNDRTRHQVNVTLSHYASDYLGNHDFKFGVEVERSNVGVDSYLNGGYFYFDYNGPFLRYSGGDLNFDADIGRLSAFAQDNWALSEKVRMELGVRWDHNRGSLKSLGTVFRTDPVAPRLGLVVDLKGNGKSILKAHYGHYYEAALASYLIPLERGEDLVQEIFVPPGEWIEISRRSGGNFSIDPDIKQPYVRQFTAGLDQTLPKDILFGAHYIYRRWENIIDDVNITGVYEPITVTNPLTGEPITVYNQLNPFENLFLITNIDSSSCSFCFLPERKYDAIELYANKIISQKLYLNGSFVWSAARGNYDNRSIEGDTGGNNIGISNVFDDPNSGINADGKLTNDPTIEFKVQAIYNWPHGINTGITFLHTSGDTFTRSFFEFGLNQPTIIFGVPRGSDRLPSINVVNLRLEKAFVVGFGQLRFTTDFFNLFNTGYETSVSTIFGTNNYLQPETYTFPRQIRIGIRYTF